jgi:hypothetical protein
MRKLVVILSVVSLTFLFVISWASEKKEFEMAGGSLAVSELAWDFGYMPKGSSVTHRFFLKNVGDKTLKIERVRPSCGCTSAPLTKNVLEPGETTELEVTFNAKNFRGKVTKSVAVMTDDSANLVTNLKFTSDVGGAVPTLVMEQETVSFDSVVVGKKISKKLTLTNNDIQPISVKLVEVPDYLVDVKLKRDRLNIGDDAELSLKLTNDSKLEGFFNKTLTLEVDGHVDYRVSLPVTGTLVSK